MMSENPIFSSVTALPPGIETVVVAKAVREQFGLQGTYSQLVSERDQNFRLSAADGTSYVVKITSFVENPDVTDFQIAALLHLEQSGLTGVPRIVRTKSGCDRGVIRNDAGNETVLRIVTWLDGEVMKDANLTPELCFRFGNRLADLDSALASFSHVGDRQELLWDMQRAAELRQLLIHIDDPDVLPLVEQVLDDFETRVSPSLRKLDCQVIHNDANDENILLDADQGISGFIDFGDMLRAPRIVDVATAAAYLRTVDDDPMRFIVPFIRGYNEHNPLSETELNLLYDLIRTRLMMTLIILYWRISARSPGDPYREKTLMGEATAFGFLRNLSNIGPTVFRDSLTA
jgi:Ser/Thr protein kinase RdoA (MazF antagonist)